MTAEAPRFVYPQAVRSSVRLARALEAEDFRLEVDGDGPRRVHVIGVIENQAPTRHLIETVRSANGRLTADRERDLAKVALVERHRGSGAIQIGLVHGLGFTERCAVGSTVAHDSHHMIVVGTSDADMAVAANELAAVGGGQIVVRDGRVLARIELPIAGLMSDESADVVANKAEALLEAIRACGCRLNNPNMQISLLGLVVIPQLRISDKGLVDVDQFKVISLVDPSEARGAR